MVTISNFKTALHTAVEDLDVEQVRSLIAEGIDVNLQDSEGRIPMLRDPSILQDDFRQERILKMLVDAGAELTSCDSEGHMQVCDILWYGNSKLVRIIIQSNMDLCAEDKRQQTALHYLAWNTNEGIVEELRKKRIVLQMSGPYETLPLWGAINGVNPRMIEYFFKSGSVSCNINFALLLRACSGILSEELLETIDILLRYKVDPLKDLNSILFIYRIKEGNTKLNPWPVVHQVVAHFSLQEQFEKHNDKITTFINSQQYIKDYYKSCQKQLEEMKTSKICKKMSLFALLVANENKLVNFASNKRLVLKLKEANNLHSGNEFYDRVIQRHLATIFKVVEYREKGITSICTNIGELYEWNDIVSEKIVSFLSYDDLESLFLSSSE